MVKAMPVKYVFWYTPALPPKKLLNYIRPADSDPIQYGIIVPYKTVGQTGSKPKKTKKYHKCGIIDLEP